MKNISVVVALAALTSTFCLSDVATAKPGPTISPSVKAAARLKYNPPRNWIRHYLGDDRYKIAGGVWKVVTTPNDKCYYPAYAAEMLRRSPNNVIGFSSPDEAIEAGYLASPIYFVQSSSENGSVQTVAVATPGSGVRSGPVYATRVTNTTRRATRVLLPDRVSSVLLPSGWEYVELASTNYQTPQGAVLDQNALVRPRTRRGGYILFGIQTMPQGANSAAMLRQQEKSLQQLSGNLSTLLTQSGRVSSGASNVVRDIRPQRVRVGGLSGLRINMKNMPGRIGSEVVYTDSMSIVARANKFYQVGTRGNAGGRGAASIIASFRPR